jgi:hypothetical protein
MAGGEAMLTLPDGIKIIFTGSTDIKLYDLKTGVI